jgi:hypothetical protein
MLRDPRFVAIMAPVHALRKLSTLHRLVLAWFVLSLFVAVASPIVKPQQIDIVCSASGHVTMVVQTEDGAVPMGSMGMDCPLCVIGGLPPAVAQVEVPMPAPLSYALRSIPAARIAAATAAPLPARGPPSFLFA